MTSTGKYVDDLKSGLQGTGFFTMIMHLLTVLCCCHDFWLKAK
jgi:hypothetical protein